MGLCSSTNMENVNKVNEETLHNSAIEKEIRELEKRAKAADAEYKSTTEQTEIKRSKNEVISKMIEVEENKKKENDRRLEALTYSLMKHGVTQKCVNEAKAVAKLGGGAATKSAESQQEDNDVDYDYEDDDDDDDDDHMDLVSSLLEIFDVATTLKKFTKELDAIKASNKGSDNDNTKADVNDDVNDEEISKADCKNGIKSIDKGKYAPVQSAASLIRSAPPKSASTVLRSSMLSWFLRDEPDENGYPSLITLMSYNHFKKIILSKVNTSNFTANDAEILALRFSDEGMVDIVEFLEFFESTLEDRMRASAFNIMQMAPGEFKFFQNLLLPPVPAGATTTAVPSSSSSHASLTTTKVDKSECSNLEIAANKLYTIFDAVAENLENKLCLAAEKNKAGTSQVLLDEFQQILVDVCSANRIDTTKLTFMASTADIDFGISHIPTIKKKDALILSERFTFAHTGCVDYKKFLQHFKGARAQNIGLRRTPFDVRISTVPPPSPTRRNKPQEEALAFPDDTTAQDTGVIHRTNSSDVDNRPVSEEKSPVKSEYIATLSAKASAKSSGKSKQNLSKKMNKKESKESKGVIGDDKGNSNGVNTEGKVDNHTLPLTIVTSPTALKKSSAPPSVLSPDVKSPLSASSADTSVEVDSLLESIRAIMEENHDVDHVEATFQKFDTNSDGALQKEEVKLTFEELKIPISPSELQAIFNLFDKDGNGAIDYNEFIDVLCEM